jgi:hypothetical protein
MSTTSFPDRRIICCPICHSHAHPDRSHPDSTSYCASGLAPALNQQHSISRAQILHARRKAEIRDDQAADLLPSRQRSPQEQWVSLVRGSTINHEPIDETLMTAPLRDQAALSAVLMNVRDLGVALISLIST